MDSVDKSAFYIYYVFSHIFLLWLGTAYFICIGLYTVYVLRKAFRKSFRLFPERERWKDSSNSGKATGKLSV